jgi:hypothetical protein
MIATPIRRSNKRPTTSSLARDQTKAGQVTRQSQVHNDFKHVDSSFILNMIYCIFNLSAKRLFQYIYMASWL